MVAPLPVPAEVLVRDNWWMLGISAALLPLMWTGMRINRFEGLALLGSYATYLTLLLT